MEMSRDAGSIPAASTRADLREIVSRLFLWTYGNIQRRVDPKTASFLIIQGFFF